MKVLKEIWKKFEQGEELFLDELIKYQDDARIMRVVNNLRHDAGVRRRLAWHLENAGASAEVLAKIRTTPTWLILKDEDVRRAARRLHSYFERDKEVIQIIRKLQEA